MDAGTDAENSTGSQRRSLGCPVQGSCHTGCNTGSTGSGSGSTAATAEHTERKKMNWTETESLNKEPSIKEKPRPYFIS